MAIVVLFLAIDDEFCTVILSTDAVILTTAVHVTIKLADPTWLPPEEEKLVMLIPPVE